MIYDRPVRKLIAECAQKLDEPFSSAEVVMWFGRHYPEVKASTVRAHIAGLTADGARNHEYLATQLPVLERVGHGLYRRARGGAPRPALRPVAAVETRSLPQAAPNQISDIVLVGCVKSKLSHAAAAQDLYTSALFTRRRRFAEESQLPWFVVSSRWGLVAPQEIIAPYDVYLGDTSRAYRRSWADFVTAQLSARLDLAGMVIELHAGDFYVQALRPALERAGAVVVDAVQVASMGETLAWYDTHSPLSTIPDALPTEDGDTSRLVDYLRDSTKAVTPTELLASARAPLSSSGLYSWWVDAAGADDLSRGLGLRLEPGLIYAGLAGATRWPSGKPSTNTLWGRLVGMHLGGRANLSTFRLTLGSILSGHLWAGTLDEVLLTAWMHDRLQVIALPVADADTLGRVETAVLDSLNPPLNLSKMDASTIRETLSRLRRRQTK